MKLSNLSNTFFIITTLTVFIISGVLVFYLLQSIIKEEVDEELLEQKAELLSRLEEAKSFDKLIIPKTMIVSFGQAPDSIVNDKNIFSDTLIQRINYDNAQVEWEPYRQLRTVIKYNGNLKQITLRMSIIETQDLVETIFIALVTVFIFITLALISVNFFSTKILWSPFQSILKRIDSFDFRSQNRYKPVSTKINEFNNLNDKVKHMTQKLTRDYLALKEFSENASHEMQTPIAIIQAKLELLFQQKDISNENLQVLKSIYQASSRLSRLHQELNLLSRIENNEFTEKQKLSFKELIQAQLSNFTEICDFKNIKLSSELESDCSFDGNKYLIEIMLSNLFGNAIKHNINNGWIKVSLSDSLFRISNSGEQPNMPTEALFERFIKSRKTSDSTGLGLSLVKQICLLHNFNIKYHYTNNHHTISISF
ncbi:MAG: HAMP domain-containing sensor histidine kinase [Calditrichaceae bacterium]